MFHCPYRARLRGVVTRRVAAGCYALPRWGEGKKRILDPGTLKKIKIPLIYYKYTINIYPLSESPIKNLIVYALAYRIIHDLDSTGNHQQSFSELVAICSKLGNG
jgi:hypothetical protein